MVAMRWEDFFLDNDYEELYDAIKERMAWEFSNDDQFWDRHDELHKRQKRMAFDEEEEKLLKYERQEFYRKRHAEKHGYTFKPKDIYGSPIDETTTLKYWNEEK